MHKLSALFLSSILGFSGSTSLAARPAGRSRNLNLQPGRILFAKPAPSKVPEVYGPFCQPVSADDSIQKAAKAFQEQDTVGQPIEDLPGSAPVKAIWIEQPEENPAADSGKESLRTGYSALFKEDPAALRDEADSLEISALQKRVQAIIEKLAARPGLAQNPEIPDTGPDAEEGLVSDSGPENQPEQEGGADLIPEPAGLPAKQDQKAALDTGPEPQDEPDENPGPAASVQEDGKELADTIQQLEQSLALLQEQKTALQNQLAALPELPAAGTIPENPASQQPELLPDPAASLTQTATEPSEIHEQNALDNSSQKLNDTDIDAALPAAPIAENLAADAALSDPALSAQAMADTAALNPADPEAAGLDECLAQKAELESQIAALDVQIEQTGSQIDERKKQQDQQVNEPLDPMTNTPAKLDSQPESQNQLPADRQERSAGASRINSEEALSVPEDQPAMQNELAPADPVAYESGLMPGNTPNLHQLKEQLAQIEQAVNAGQSDPALAAQAAQIEQTLASMETVSVYRLYNPNSGEHFYTPSAQEKDHLVQAGWNFEGTGWRAPKNDTSAPVYRLYNPNAGDHHYTTDAVEKDHLAAVGWKDEGIAWYSDPFQGVEIFRAYNPNAVVGAHHFTSNALERDALVNAGWRNEAVGFYARFMYSLCPDPSTGQVVWYDENDQKLAGDQQINGCWYYFNPDTGTPVTGLFTSPQTGQTRNYDASGRHTGGRQNLGGRWYSFDAGSGLMARNKLVSQSDGTLCYYGSDGAAATGTFTLANAVFTADANGNITGTTLNNVPLFRQDDPGWAYTSINGVSFRSSGCAPTVLACALSALTGSTVSPYTIGVMLGNAGYMNSGFLGTSGNGIVYAARSYGVPVRGSLSQSQAASILKAGGAITAAVGPGTFCPVGYTHELLVYGFQNGNVFIHDPLGMGPDGWYPLSLIFDQRSYDKDDCAGGGPTFGLSNTMLPW